MRPDSGRCQLAPVAVYDGPDQSVRTGFGRPLPGTVTLPCAAKARRRAVRRHSEPSHRRAAPCDVGSKKNSKGYKETWIGYKLHLDVACGQIPVSCMLTSASVHDSQVAIPLMTITGARVSYLYDLMDAAYDAAAIHDHSKALGHAPIIDRNYRAQHEAKAEWAKEVERMKLIHMPDPDDRLFDFRTMAERVNARLKDEFGARVVRVRGAIKVKCHLMFGVVALAVDQILRLTQFRPAPA